MYGLVNDGCHACAEGRYRTGTSENDDPSKCALCPAGFAQKETGQANKAITSSVDHPG